MWIFITEKHTQLNSNINCGAFGEGIRSKMNPGNGDTIKDRATNAYPHKKAKLNVRNDRFERGSDRA
jgi:hypothetical protein